jgi:type IV secretion system protein VirD4
VSEVSIPAAEVFEHILILGAPGAGKSASIFIPNLLAQAASGRHNLVVTDPKAELLRIAGSVFREAGWRVWIYAPMIPGISATWNMVDVCTTWEAADRVALTLVENTGKDESQPFFHQTAQVLLRLLLLQCRAALPGATMCHVRAVASLATLEQMMSFTRNAPDPEAAAEAVGFWDRVVKNQKLIGSITMEFPQRLRLWALPQIRAVSTPAEGVPRIDFRDFHNPEHRTVLFVLNSLQHKKQLAPLTATFFKEFFTATLEAAKEAPGGRLPRPVWFIMDEFANIGQVPDFPEYLTLCRGHGIGVVMGIQSRSQLADLYGDEGAETIQNACRTFVCYPRLGPEDAEWLSRLLGDATVITSGRSWEPGDLFAKRSQSESRRRLMTPDEIRALPEDKIIVLAGTRRPVLLRQCRWYLQERWQHIRPVELDAFQHGRQVTVPGPAELLAELGIRPAPSGRTAAEPAPAAAAEQQVEIREVEL